MKENTVIRLGGHHYRIRYRDHGILRPEDRGLWRALRVTWDGDHWGIHDDDDYLITDSGEVIAREIGWDLRREKL